MLMGAWGSDGFSNDDALDWLQDFAEAPTLEMLKDTLEHIVVADAEDLEAPDCSEAIAAAEIVAALSGKSSAKIPDELKAWLQTDHGLNAKELRPLARKAMQSIEKGSDLQELWDESDFKNEWHAELTDLIGRLA
jgi:hypothetical protein